MKISSLFLVFLLLPQAVAALSLEEMQQAALENRALVKRYQTEVEKSREDIRIARSGYFPSVDLSYRAYRLDESSSTEERENSVFSSSISYNLFSGFKDKYSLSSAEMRNEVESLRLVAVEQDIQLLVALQYLAVFNQQSRLKVARAAYDTLEKLYLDSKNRYDVGLLDKNEVLKFKVDYDNANLSVRREEANLQKELHLLARATDMEIGFDDLDFEEFNTPPSLGDKTAYEKRMLSRRSELRALEGLAESAARLVKVQQADYYPSLDLIGRYLNYDDNFVNGQGNASEDELRAELMMSFNLFDGFADEAQIARARADVRSLRYDLSELQSAFKTELKNIFVDYQVSLATVKVARDDISYAEENLRITELKYREGLQRQLDLLDAVSNLARAQSNYVAVVRTVFENYFKVIRMVEEFPGKK